ncbi:MAG: hypothetical protein ACRD4W_09905 [Nitrososphaeraceae archaeon]
MYKKYILIILIHISPKLTAPPMCSWFEEWTIYLTSASATELSLESRNALTTGGAAASSAASGGSAASAAAAS